MKDFKLSDNSKNGSGFKIPDNYFDDFQTRLDQRLYKKESKVISFYQKNKTWFYTAAAILVVAFSIPFADFTETSYNQASTLDIENYITNRSSISEEEIINELTQEDIEALKQDLLPEISEDDILLENGNSYDYLNL